ncbi:ribitol-5-phosphate 2-dehydrogenase [Paenibacillus sp. 1_12]|uniref:alcohol dehydrogenase catalytic domain-containing protein n=1 Tax=Paenibacillus sp. 1_12 TaxID=1566278 RepID=UPI0008E4D1E2|nr:alcohol dehydrogenase catalytic domain-containing protein [Paenibacillus sp. 1_12]SFL99890.1 ribitol-5-phosphate 2-dehydrogenase [Paenibacillus sp. 1_12]
MLQPNVNHTRIQSQAYRLIKPREVVEAAIVHEVHDYEVVVEPSIASICHADLRYFTGQRRPEALARKLPMALIHEGIGTIMQSATAELKPGQRVVIVPNIPGYLLKGIVPEECCPACKSGNGDNYCHCGKFLGSGMDGIAQNRLVIPASCAIPVPDEIPDEIAVLAELCTVSYQALHHVEEQLKNARVAVFGDGPVGYLAAAMLYHVYGVSADRLQVFGAIPDKLDKFDFANRSLVQEYDFSSGGSYDIAVECTGGRFSESAINQAIDILKPEGHLILMGVTEDKVPINTRDVLEKGLTLRGSSRSSTTDYYPVLEAMKDPSCQATLRKLLPDQITHIHAANDFTIAMEQAAAHRDWRKTILEFHW